MTNSDYIEELLYKAYDEGFFEEMHDLVAQIIERGVDRTDAYVEAYNTLSNQ